MQIEVMEHFGLKKYLCDADFFETETVVKLFRQLKRTIPEGQLISITGVVGIGKTTYLERIQRELIEENKVIVAKSLSIEKSKTNLTTLITALFYDVSGDKNYRVPKLGEKRERDLRDLIKSKKKPVVLFVDEAHDLHHKTLTGLKRLMEVIRGGGGKLSIVLAGHPKLKNELKSPNMEEVGTRTAKTSLDTTPGMLRDYINWLLNDCTVDDVTPSDIIEAEAIEYLSDRLSTPLQVEHHLIGAMEQAFVTGIKPITLEVLMETMSKRINDLEPTLIRNGYNERVIAEQFRFRPAEIKKFFNGEIDSARAKEMTTRMREAGLPI